MTTVEKLCSRSKTPLAILGVALTALTLSIATRGREEAAEPHTRTTA